MSPSRRHFVGAAFEQWPGLSASGVMLRITRLNRYVPSDYRFALGINVRRNDDLHALMTFSDKRKEQLKEALDVPARVRAFWDLPNWMPFACEPSVLQVKYGFRYCPECLRYGYHSLLHQAPWLARCVWHGAGLREDCHRCGTRLLLGRGSGPWLGVCECGHDHVDDSKALRGLDNPARVGDLCARYLSWAALERARTTLIAPSPTLHSVSTLTRNIKPPEAFTAASPTTDTAAPRVHCVRPRPESRMRLATEDTMATAAKLDCLDDTRCAMIEAPGRLGRRVAAAASKLARELPPESLSDRELALFLGDASAAALPNSSTAKRRSILEICSLPLTRVGERSFLDLHCLSKPLLRVAHQLFRWLDLKSAEGFQAQHECDLPVCVAAVGEILARGYAEGIRVVLGRHLPDLYRAGRNRPHLSEPWVLLREQEGSAVEVSVTWARVPYTPE